MKVSNLWNLNKDRKYIQFLYQETLRGSLGKHFDTIRFWINEFRMGKRTTIIVNGKGIVQDGNHRLVAAVITGIDYLEVT